MEDSKSTGFSEEPFGASGSVADPGFPDEPFECPYCGQLLAPTCRICVSCKLPIDPARIHRSRAPEPEAVEAIAPPEEPPVRFSWTMFFAVLAAAWVSSTVVLHFAGLVAGQLIMSGVQLLSAIWVFFDARQKLIRKPLRWAVGSLILWIVIFPWYLLRRQKLNAPCPFVEAESGPFTKVMLLVIFILFMVGMLASRYGGTAFKSVEGKDGQTLVFSPKKK
jgi:hypothetical protein